MKKRKSYPPAPPEPPRYPLVFETFRPLDHYEERQLTRLEPACFNGFVHFRKYRITVEEIPEAPEVLAARLQALWDESDNYHDYDYLKRAARKIGYEFVGERGSKRRVK